jgi:hypothetical protein
MKILFVLAAFVGALVFLWPKLAEVAKEEKEQPISWSSVERVQWSDEPDFLRSMLIKREPVVIVDAPSFPQLHTLDAVGRHAAIARNCMRSSQSTFFYYDLTHALTETGTCRSNLKYEIEDVPMQSLIDRVGGRDRTEFYYYSSPLNKTSPELFDLLDFSPYNRTVAGLQVNFWLASQGCVSRLHYDASHNLFVQLAGRKRFQLVSPKEGFDRLPLYPASHPCQRASSFDFSSEKRLEAKEVVLDSGDLLYIPPFYFHHVESLTPSSSLNMYLPSKEMSNAVKINEFDFGISNDWLDVVQLSAVHHILRNVVARVFDLKKFSKRLEARFELSFQDTETLSCETPLTKGALDEDFSAYYCTSLSLDKVSKMELSIVVDRLVGLFEKLPVGTREILLMDWVETRILWAVEPALITKYLRNCF